MAIKITNFSDKTIVNIALPLIIGNVLGTSNSKISVENISRESDKMYWPVVNGKFKILVKLQHGRNQLIFRYKNFSVSLILIYEPLQCKRYVRLIYIRCKDDDGMFQAPAGEDNSEKSACQRLSLAAQMLQTFTFDKLAEHKLKSKTFKLEERDSSVVCHSFTSSLTVSEAYKLNEEQLWSHFAVELMNSDLRDGDNCKFLAFLSCTRFVNNRKEYPQNHEDVMRLTFGKVALGGGGLALFGTGCLHTWAQTIQEVPWRFADKRMIDRLQLMDDSANRGWHWACYSTGLGATLHELGHTFDLGHTKGGIMARGFDDIHKHFIIDMFYYDHPFHKEYNPFYKESATLSHTIPLYSTPASADQPLSTSPEKIYISNIDDDSIFPDPLQGGEKPWRIPNPPDCYSAEKLAVHVGGAYWTRSSALLLYYHKWFNNVDSEADGSISIKGTILTSPHGIRVIELRDEEGTSYNHLEFLDSVGKMVVDLTDFDIFRPLSDETQNISLVAEDSFGNVLKSKLNRNIFTNSYLSSSVKN